MAIPYEGDGSGIGTAGFIGGQLNNYNRDTMSKGGFKQVGVEALPDLTASAALFPNAPATAVAALLTLRGGGNITVTFDGTTTATATVGNDYAGGSTYLFMLSGAQLLLCKAIKTGTISSGYITYFKLA